MTTKPASVPFSDGAEPARIAGLDAEPWGCGCGNWTDRKTCEACGRTLNRTDQQEASDG